MIANAGSNTAFGTIPSRRPPINVPAIDPAAIMSMKILLRLQPPDCGALYQSSSCLLSEFAGRCICFGIGERLAHALGDAAGSFPKAERR